MDHPEESQQEAVIIAVQSDSESAQNSPSVSSEEIEPNQLPASKGFRCYDCGAPTAVRMCICQFPLKSYCQSCAQMHLKRKGPKMHLLVPIHANVMLTSEESVPDFITREVFSNQVTEALLNNLSRVLSAKEDLRAACDRLHEEINQYRDCRLGALEEVEQELKTRINAALRGIEDIRYQPDFPPKNEPERLILMEWKNNIENLTERLSMFVSSATVEHLIIQLPTISHFHANYAVLYPPTSHEPRTYLPCIQSNNLKSLSLTTHTWRNIPLALHTDITYNSAVGFLPSGDIFACGGKTHNKAYVIDGLTFAIQEIAPMFLSRHSHGLVTTLDFAYVFGGKAQTDYKECEKYSLKTKSWIEMHSMYKPRSSITPCRHFLKIYIAGGFSSTIEVFNLITEVFDLHPLSTTAIAGTTCISSDTGVLIFAKQALIDLNLSDFSETKVAPLPGLDWWSSISPVFFNGEVYFSRRCNSAPQVYRVNLAAKRLEEVA